VVNRWRGAGNGTEMARPVRRSRHAPRGGGTSLGDGRGSPSVATSLVGSREGGATVSPGRHLQVARAACAFERAAGQPDLGSRIHPGPPDGRQDPYAHRNGTGALTVWLLYSPTRDGPWAAGRKTISPVVVSGGRYGPTARRGIEVVVGGFSADHRSCPHAGSCRAVARGVVDIPGVWRGQTVVVA